MLESLSLKYLHLKGQEEGLAPALFLSLTLSQIASGHLRRLLDAE
jgi:hypothetical protein